MTRLRRRLSDLFLSSPTLRRLAWHGRRISRSLDRRFVVRAVRVIVVFVLLAAFIVWLVEKDHTIAALADCIYWAFTTVLGQGQASFVVSPIGRLLSWTLIIFGVAIWGARRARHRLPHQGGPGLGRIGLPRPRRRLRLERHGP
jgi:hypothetical protein